VRGVLILLLGVTAVIATALPGEAELYKLTAPDGTIYFTNTPTDLDHRRTGFAVAPTPLAPTGQESQSRGSPAYFQEIAEAAARYGVPERLISAVIQAESGFNPRARSQKGAQGLMQLMPETASALGVRNALDPRENIDAGVRHLRGLVERFGNNLRLAIAAYNAGEKAVVAYGGIPPYPETREYVVRVLRFYGAPGAGDEAPVRGVYHKIAPDGTVIYTNLQPRDVP
jgi:soluble lytic murein transglycosylase-like protein